MFRSVSVDVSKISQSCKQYNNYSLGCLYTPQLLALLSRKPAVGTRLEASLLFRNVPAMFILDSFVLLLMNLKTFFSSFIKRFLNIRLLALPHVCLSVYLHVATA